VKHWVGAIALVAVLLAGRASPGQAGATCVTLTGAVSGAKGRLDEVGRKIESIDLQVGDLQRRKADLVQQRTTLLSDLRDAETAARQGCAKCEDALKKVDAKHAALVTAASNAAAMTKEIQRLAGDAKKVFLEAKDLSVEWESAECADLSPARTDKATIAKCAKIDNDFTKNRRKAGDLSTMAGRLKARSGSVASEVRKRLEGVDPLIADAIGACGESDKLGPVRLVKRELDASLVVLGQVKAISADVDKVKAARLGAPETPAKGK
jgi:chromosome segregation ATPase